ncbi:MAG: galactokinase [Parasporobacterium sp.]|nr:galactokinase [Parasporobacterium sp.]
MNRFAEYFGYETDLMIKAPGRTELGGNHTDHQHGNVLCAPVDLYITAYYSRNDLGQIRIVSEGHGEMKVDLQDTSVKEEEKGTSEAIIRGIADAFRKDGLPGFDAWMTSDVPAGSGLSSSAAFEILLGRIGCALTKVSKTGEELAILGQYVENTYFGKPCGLMDQMACAADGVLAIDFEDPSHPVCREVKFDFQKAGYALCIIKCGAGHENLTDEYAAIPEELGKLCGVFGKKVLREIPEEEFFSRIPEIREICGDRAVLRAMHVYADNSRVLRQVQSLQDGDLESYLKLVNESGRSSWELLQNVIPRNAALHQEMALALALAEKALRGRGAVRVHGGGFAGTIQAYVPIEMMEEFRQQMEAVLGADSCIFVNIG